MTLQFDVWPWKTIGHLFYATSSSMHHFIAIGEFKLELQFGNAQSGSKSSIFFSRVTLQFDVWPWKTIGHLFYATSSFLHYFIAICDFKLELTVRKRPIWVKFRVNSPETPNLGQIRRFLEPRDLEIWRMTLKNNRAPLICYFKLCVAFCSHWWIKTIIPRLDVKTKGFGPWYPKLWIPRALICILDTTP